MLERLKQIPARLLELWNKYTKKQKTIIISIVASVILALVIMILVLGRTQYIEFYKFEDTKTAKAAVELLEASGIAYKLQSDNVTVYIDAEKHTEAVFAMTEFESDSDFALEDLFNNAMGQTNTDKKLRLNIYQITKVENKLKKWDGIEDASVLCFPKDKTYSILEADKDSNCTVALTINSNFNKDMALAVAVAVASAIGNSNTDLVTVVDQKSNILFSKELEEERLATSKNLEYRIAYNNLIVQQVMSLGIANGFDQVDAVPNLSLNMDEESVVFKEFLAAEGLEQGLFSTLEKVASENTPAEGGPVGTDSNDETDYYMQTSNGGSSSYESMKATYTPSEKLTTIMKETGALIPEESSLAIVLRQAKVITEKDLRLQGALEGTTFDEYVLNNSDPVPLTLGEEYWTAFSNATGIPADEISIQAWQVFTYYADEAAPLNWDLILKIVLAVLIAGMLIFVVFRGMAPVEVTELEPELSVEQLLATTKENQSLDDIEFSEKSETRKMIEKFVDENPEAVANLLRTWLEDDWE